MNANNNNNDKGTSWIYSKLGMIASGNNNNNNNKQKEGGTNNKYAYQRLNMRRNV